eukprot:4242325-Prymnesium_polylepis.1
MSSNVRWPPRRRQRRKRRRRSESPAGRVRQIRTGQALIEADAVGGLGAGGGRAFAARQAVTAPPSPRAVPI